MRTVRIIIGSNDGEKIFRAHMGTAKSFHVYDLSEDGTFKVVAKRENTTRDIEDHESSEKMKAVMDIISDADVVVGRRMSPNFKRMAAKTRLQPVVVEMDSLEEIMSRLSKSFDEIISLVEQRRSGSFPEEIPVLK